MAKTLILHDLPQSEAEALLSNLWAGCTVFSASPAVHPCIGCFGCWIKTPGKCVIDDRGAGFLTLLPAQDEVVLLSRMVFGGVSPDIKAVLDRSIGFMLPYFCDRQGEMHHARRFDAAPRFRYVFYGPDITPEEKATAQKLAAANALNFGAERWSVQFYQSAQAGAEALA
ncbi:MAG: flavodoxin family protein [Christensenellaceae bacterium]|jgi:hypothetical protein|nr:flavodoxin family protein [Christensenellaceae bacterium]